MKHPHNLIWIDLEMTGLDPAIDVIIEIATIVTDAHLKILAEGPVLAIHQSNSVLANMNTWCITQHGRSGLTEALVEEVDGQLRQRAMVKIKVNRGVFDRENLALLWEALVERTGAVLVLSRGNVGVLWRR